MLGLIIQCAGYPGASENPKQTSFTAQPAFGSSLSVFQMVYAHEMQVHIHVCLIKKTSTANLTQKCHNAFQRQQQRCQGSLLFWFPASLTPPLAYTMESNGPAFTGKEVGPIHDQNF